MIASSTDRRSMGVGYTAEDSKLEIL